LKNLNCNNVQASHDVRDANLAAQDPPTNLGLGLGLDDFKVKVD
jgi:hypothetical protein